MVQGLASQILWIIPTFIGKIPEPEERLGQERLEQENIIRNIERGPGQAQEKVGALTDNLSSAPLEKNWNRLLSLQGVFANIGINILNVSLPGLGFLDYHSFSVSWQVDILDDSSKSSKSLERYTKWNVVVILRTDDLYLPFLQK